jgi:hypothetical protein
MLMTSANGALQNDSAFLIKKSRRESVTSAARPATKVSVARVKPIIYPSISIRFISESLKLPTVKYMKCQPHASFLQIALVKQVLPPSCRSSKAQTLDLRWVGVIHEA